MNAAEILRRSAQHIEDRAAARDQPQGERSMARTVGAFNALTGHQLSERDGWLFMASLKMARACTTPTGQPDDYEDLSAYAALAGESVAGGIDAPQPVTVGAKPVAECPFPVPEGYHYAAQDSDGAWFGYRGRPIARTARWGPYPGGGCVCIGTTEPNPNWRDTLVEVKP